MVAIWSVAPVFLSTGNLGNVLAQTAVIALLAIGQLLVILTRGIDLSVGSSMALAAVVGALVFDSVQSGWVVILAMLGTGLAVGVVNGMGYVWGRLPHPFIITLATLSIARGLALWLADGQPVQGVPDVVQTIGGDSVGWLPYSAFLVAGVAILVAVLLTRIVWGRWIYAVGGNPDAARRTGIPVDAVLISVYVLSGLMAGIAAIVTSGRLNAGSPTFGQLAELDCIAAVVIGGASFLGGRGIVGNALVGALMIGVIRNGMNLLERRRVPAADRDRRRHRPRGRVGRPARPAREPGPGAPGGAGMTGARPVPTLAVRGATKRFGAVLALDGVDVEVHAGEVLALLGDNGAGKSTLIKCLSGVHRLDSGVIEMDGRPVSLGSPAAARSAGIETVYQDLALFDNLDPAANFYAGRELAGPRWLPRGLRFLRRGAMADATADLLRRLQVGLPDGDSAVGLMSGGQRQAIAVARAAAFASRVVVPGRADGRARGPRVPPGARPDHPAAGRRPRRARRVARDGPRHGDRRSGGRAAARPEGRRGGAAAATTGAASSR